MRLPTFSEWLANEEGVQPPNQQQIDPALNSKIGDETMKIKQKNPKVDLHMAATQAAINVAKQSNKPVTAVAAAQTQMPQQTPGVMQK